MNQERFDSYNLSNQILDQMHVLSHDGYDAYGPESNLHDLYALVKMKDKNSSKLKMQQWHREYWFHGKDDEEYELIRETILDFPNEMFRCLEKRHCDQCHWSEVCLDFGLSIRCCAQCSQKLLNNIEKIQRWWKKVFYSPFQRGFFIAKKDWESNLKT